MENRILRAELKHLKLVLKQAEAEALSTELIKQHIFGLAKTNPTPPRWLIDTPRHISKGPGVPSLFLSDWHWGEVVDPRQIEGVNAYNLHIAHERARNLTVHAIDLLENHVVNPTFPGIVIILGGDFFSGDIHPELVETNEVPTPPALVDLFGVMITLLTTFADHFGHVFIPAVTGNHGRTTEKPRHKNRVYTNYDWLLYALLEKHFEHDRRFQFRIASGADIPFNIFGHRYLLTHGDQFRGGDGMIGALGPILRGDYKKRARNVQIGRGYDTMLVGHWHQLIMLLRVIVNNSLKGYDEYAYDNNFPFEAPSQGMWFTHPQHGIIHSTPILVDRPPKRKLAPWVSWPQAA